MTGLTTTMRAESDALDPRRWAALAVLLSKLGAGTDIPLGTRLLSRSSDTRETLDDYPGDFTVRHADVSGNPAFSALVLRMRAAERRPSLQSSPLLTS